MPDQTKDFVALFIDWDNLAISTAADLGGATPDVKRIVQTAQQYGMVLIARAYAEWTATSERLGVYRAGIETVYAPTFRYETDPNAQTPRGKSLADPCMVADCVDILHLLPSITTFVIVSGDKDLIPVVRLAQLRGKRVVVIGPDYAAGVLRDIADEFISYRKVVEAGNGRAGVIDTVELVQASRRRPGGRVSVAPPVEQTGFNPPRPSRNVQASPSSQGSRLRTHDNRHTVGTELASVAPAHDVLAAEPAIRTEPQVESTERQLPDLQSVYTTVVDILRQRIVDGKPRTRATNIKDALMVRLPGFSERRYGFSKFKDFLAAMEKTGEIIISSAGPVHWVSLPAPANDEPAEPVVAPAEQQETSVRQQDEPAVTALDAQQAELVRFVVDLKRRSRWLTYTYVLTNLITHLSKVRPGVSAETAARSVLNQLVQDGVLRVDREPQEVEVGGIKHRVRMCHVQEAHPQVIQMMDGSAPEAGALAVEETPVGPDRIIEAQPEEPTGEIRTAPEVEREDAGQERDLIQAGGVQASDAEPGDAVVNDIIMPETDSGAEEQQDTTPAWREEAPVAPNGEELAAPDATNRPESNDDVWSEAAGIVDDLQQVFLGAKALPGMESGGPSLERAPQHAPGLLAGSSGSLEDALLALRRVVLELTGPKKPHVGIAGLKAKLSGALGHFDEQEFGFSKFKDFVAAAEKAGYVNVERVGTATWVSYVPSLDDNAEGSPEGQVQPDRQGSNGGERKRRRPSQRRSPANTAALGG